MNQLIREFEKAIKNAWIDQPADIDRLLECNREIGKTFAPVVYSTVFFDQTSLVTYDYYMRAKTENGDFETLKKISADFICSTGYSMKTDYHMYDSHTLFMRAACAIHNIDNFKDLADLLKILQCYLVRLFFWTDLCIPWNEFSREFSKTLKKKVV